MITYVRDKDKVIVQNRVHGTWEVVSYTLAEAIEARVALIAGSGKYVRFESYLEVLASIETGISKFGEKAVLEHKFVYHPKTELNLSATVTVTYGLEDIVRDLHTAVFNRQDILDGLGGYATDQVFADDLAIADRILSMFPKENYS